VLRGQGSYTSAAREAGEAGQAAAPPSPLEQEGEAEGRDPLQVPRGSFERRLRFQTPQQAVAMSQLRPAEDDLGV